MTPNRYPPRRMTADEAARQGLGAARGIIVGLAWSSLFWAVIVAAYILGQR